MILSGRSEYKEKSRTENIYNKLSGCAKNLTLDIRNNESNNWIYKTENMNQKLGYLHCLFIFYFWVKWEIYYREVILGYIILYN